MKNKIICTIISLFCSIAMLANNKLIISLHSEAKPSNPDGSNNSLGVTAIDAVAQQFGCTNIHPVKKGKVYVLTLANENSVHEAAQAMLRTGLCRYAEADARATIGDWKVTATIPNDSAFDMQWGLHNDGSFSIVPATAGADIDLLRAWDVEEGDTSVIVAVLDAGIRSTHPDVKGRLWINHNEIPGNGIDDDGNDYTDDTLGWNMVSDTNNIEDDNGHGSHVAGIIGSNVNDSTAIAGVDKHCKLMIVKCANNVGFLDYSWLTEAIYYAVDNGARIINISAGGATPSNILQDAVAYAVSKNVLVIAAMMNSGTEQKFYPAAYPGVLAVGATDPQDKLTYFSVRGSHISVCAPGHHIISLAHTSDTVYHIVSGTSQAAPHVAGIAALLLAQDSARTAAQLKSLIERNAEDLVGDVNDAPGWDKYYGHGRVNAYRALIDQALSVANITGEGDDTWVVYPNPATDKLKINFGGYGNYNVLLRTVTGAVQYSGVYSGEATIPVSQMPRGNYILTLQQGAQSRQIPVVLR